MFSVYVLRSLRNGKRYIGFTGTTVMIRLEQHNQGTNAYTKHNRPFELIHMETLATKTEAIQREKFLKSGKGREFLDKVLK